MTLELMVTLQTYSAGVLPLVNILEIIFILIIMEYDVSALEPACHWQIQTTACIMVSFLLMQFNYKELYIG